MDGLALDLENFAEQSISVEIGPDGVSFPKSDLKFSKEGISKISTGTTMSSLQKINQADIHIEGLLGKGASGFVQKGIYKPTNYPIAIKNVNIYDKSKRHQLLNDLKVHLDEGFSSENLIQFYGAYYEDGTIKIVLEYMDMGSLRHVMKNLKNIKKTEPPCVDEVTLAKITQQILFGLDFLHTKKHQVHRDIKPENILVNSSGKIKLADFGISKELERTQAFCATFVGTMIYMSPERMEGKEYGYSSDLWSLGLIILELITGEYPYPIFQNFIETIQNVINSPAPCLPADGKYSLELIDFIKKCLNKDKHQRSSASELLKHPWITNNILGGDNAVSEWILSFNNGLILENTSMTSNCSNLMGKNLDEIPNVENKGKMEVE